MRHLVLLVVLVLGFCCGAQGDIVVFKSGDRLSGQLVQLQGGKLVLESVEAGRVTVDISRVERLTTDEPVNCHLLDGTIVTGKLRVGGPGHIALEQSEATPARRLAFDELAAINPPVEPEVKWTGDATAGFTGTHGNTFDESGSITFNVTRRSQRDRTRAWGTYLVSRTKDSSGDKKTTEESIAVGSKYDYFWTEKFYTYFKGTLKKDHIADLDHRLIGGIGVGYQWVEDDSKSFSTDIGVSELCEQYTSRDSATGLMITTRNDEASVRMAYQFAWQVNERLSLQHNLDYYPSMGDFTDYFLTTDAELRLAFTESMFSSFKATLDYDPIPAAGVGSTDTKYILGLGWNF